ncbi:hypothetical protein ACFXGI_24055 [Streptomyces sp. NPDC059355]|uniref:hypothetical protein n=1 Tax=Streptomyces sp. NPDC059355 TaxID=3346811 RepID=UPI0036B57E93
MRGVTAVAGVPARPSSSSARRRGQRCGGVESEDAGPPAANGVRPADGADRAAVVAPVRRHPPLRPLTVGGRLRTRRDHHGARAGP